MTLIYRKTGEQENMVFERHENMRTNYNLWISMCSNLSLYMSGNL